VFNNKHNEPKKKMGKYNIIDQKEGKERAKKR
jgi:hypothetical protein